MNDKLQIVGLRETRETVATGLEMFNKNLDTAEAGENVGILLRGLDKKDVERGMAAATAVFVAVRLVYVARLYPTLAIARHIARGLAPVLPAVAAVLAIRLAAGDGRTPGRALAELAVFVVLVPAATLVLERRLLTEALGYLRSPGSAGPLDLSPNGAGDARALGHPGQPA